MGFLTRVDLLGGSFATGVVGGVTNDGDSGDVGEVGGDKVVGVVGVLGSGIVCIGCCGSTTGSGSNIG